MAVYFKLIDKVTDLPVSLSKVDEDICKLILKCEPHDKHYGGDVFNWFDSIGFQLASGKTLEDGKDSVREYYQTSEMWAEELPMIEQIIDYLQSKYTCKSW